MTTDLDQMDHRINVLGAALFFDPATLEKAGASGIDDFFILYAGGRAGAMGDVTVSQVQSAFAFFAPRQVERVWPRVLDTATPSHLARVFADSMAAAARRRWAEEPSAVVATIGREVVDSVHLLGLPLFAGWASQPVPADPVGAAAVTVMTLRELRGDVNVQSVARSGMSPLEAELAASGEDRARLHGWKPPYPEVAHLVDAAAAVEAETSRRMHEIYGRVDAAKVEALADAVAELATPAA